MNVGNDYRGTSFMNVGDKNVCISQGHLCTSEFGM